MDYLHHFAEHAFYTIKYAASSLNYFQLFQIIYQYNKLHTDSNTYVYTSIHITKSSLVL